MEPGSYIAIGAALIALLGTRLTYKAAMQGLENQRVLADREVAGGILDATSVELGEVDDRLARLADSLVDEVEVKVGRWQELVGELRKTCKQMELQHERLRIRFRSNVADSYELALNSILIFLGDEGVAELRRVRVRRAMGMEGSSEVEARRASFETFRAEKLPQVVQVLAKSREDFTLARSNFRDAAYEMIGIALRRRR